MVPSQVWHSCGWENSFSSDSLLGTSNYGTYVSGPVSASEFSSLFNSSSAFTEVMFMTGDKSVFLITTLDQLRNTSSSPQRVRARSSSLSPKPRLSFH